MQRNNHHDLALESELEGNFENETEGEGAHEFEGELAHELGEAEGEGESLFGEGEGEGEGEFEGEAHPEGEFEGELAHEFEGETAHEFEGEDELLFGQGEGEFAGEFSHESGFGEGEQFFGKALRGIGRFVKNNAGTFKAIGRIAAPLVAKAVGGALGGPAGAMIGSKLGSFVAGQLKEMQAEMEFAGESAHESHESSHEGELEAHEVTPVGQHEALGELFAQRAVLAASEAEAEAFIGAATTATITPRERAALRRVLGDMVSGAAVLTRVLRLRRSTRPAVRLVPDIVRRTTRSLVRCAASGRPVTRQLAARVMAAQTRRVLGSPRYAASAMSRSYRRARAVGGGGFSPSSYANGAGRRRTASYRY